MRIKNVFQNRTNRKIFLYGMAIVLCLAAFCTAFLQKKDADASKLMKKEIDGIMWRYYIDSSVQDSPAEGLNILEQTISSSLTIPDSFTDEYGTHKVKSIGNADVSAKDSFFVDSEIVTNKTMIDIDASNITSDLTINDYAFYRQSKIYQLILPSGNVTIGDKVLYCSSSTIVADSPNVLYKGTHDNTIKIKAPDPSSSKDYIGGNYGFVSNGDTTTHKFTLSHNMADNHEVRRDYLYVGTDYDIKDESTDNSRLAKMATLSYIPEKTGHTFNGYYERVEENGKGAGIKYIDEDGKLVTRKSTDSAKFTEDKTLYAAFTPNTYTLEYKNTDGAGCDDAPASYTYGNRVSLPIPQKKGYTFAGWYSDESYKNESFIGTEIKETQTGNLTLYAKWTPNTFTVKFNKNHANASGDMPDQTFSYDTKETLRKNTMTVAGYTFTGWNTRADGNGSAYADENEILNLTEENGKTITLYAQWKANKDTKYTVYYVYKALRGADETVTEPLKGTTDTTVTPSAENGAKKGFITPDSKELTIKGDGTSSITYTYRRATYNVTVNRAEGIDSVDGEGTYPYGTQVVIQSRAKNGYAGNGFSIRSGEGEPVQNGCDEDTYTFLLGADDIVINAHAKARTYTITYETNGGTITGEKPVTYTHTQGVKLPDAEKKGYTLKGWYTDTDPSVLYTRIPETMYGDRTFCAKWENAAYPVYLHTNGGTVSADGYAREEENDVYAGTHRYGTPNILPDESRVNRAGYTFGGWYKTPSCAAGEEQSGIESGCMEETHVYAKWIPMEWTITYETNKGTLDGKETVSYQTGDTVKLPTKENIYLKGFSFAGWYDNQFCEGEAVTEIRPEDMGNKRYFAKWSTKPYTITYNTMGGTINEAYEESYYYNDKVIPLPTNVTKSGYSFLAWWDGTDIVKEITKEDYRDKTFTALWQSNSSMGVMQIVTEEGETGYIQNRKTFAGDGIKEKVTEYYYTTLNTEEKLLYGAFYSAYRFIPEKGKDQFTESCYITLGTKYTRENVANAQVAFLRDHPEVFWVRYFKMGAVFEGNGKYYCHIVPIPAYKETLYRADMEQYQYYFNSTVKGLGIESTDTVYQKVSKIEKYIIKNCSYDDFGITLNENTSNDTRAVGRMLVTKEGCCEAYAKLTKILCDYYSIPCILVSGSNHMWNQIKIGSAWYGYDATADDARGDTYYFLKSASVFKEDWGVVTNTFFIDTSGNPITSYGCLPVPALSSKSYTEAGSKSGTASAGIPKKNTKYTSGNIRYVVTKSAKTNGTVAVYGLKKKTAASVSIPSTVKIKGYTFKVTVIKKNAVKGLKKLKKVTIGSNVTTIETAAFSGNKKLTSVSIKSKKLKSIGGKAFYGCKKLKKLTVKSTSLKKAGKGAVKGIYKKAVIDVPGKCVKKYKKLFKGKGLQKEMKVK